MDTTTELKMGEKNSQCRKENLDFFKLQESLVSWKQNTEKWRVGGFLSQIVVSAMSSKILTGYKSLNKEFFTF